MDMFTKNIVVQICNSSAINQRISSVDSDGKWMICDIVSAVDELLDINIIGLLESPKVAKTLLDWFNENQWPHNI